MKTKVLVVDDDQQTCQLIKTILVSAGMDVAFLTDSRAAAARLHTEKMDLLFLDLHMPKHGGFDLLNSMRGSGVNRRTPVVMITGDQDPKVLARGFEAGAN
ncbi:MAG: response regulator, partial [Candidatus Acidiferrales bacterium]